MPLVRFTVRNEFGLGQPELYGDCTGEDGDSKGVLSGVVVAGLVGILRQLGDLAEFAAEVFHGIQEQVTVTASRSRKLTSRVRRIESALPPLEKTVLSQTSHIHFSYTAGYEWHPFMQNERNHFINNDLPLFVMESYEQCRDPPRLHLLDKFDIGGPGSCLRRYSDPTFFKKESGDLVEANDVKVQRDKSYFKRKKKRLSQRNRAISRAASISKETSRMHLSSPTDDGQTTSQTTSSVGLGCTSNMLEQSEEHEQLYVREQSDVQAQPQTRGQFNCLEPSNTHDSRNGSGYIEYLINQGPVSKPEEKLLGEFQSRPNQQADSKCSILATGCTEVVDDNILCSPSREQPVTCVSPDSRYKKDEAFHSEYEQRIEEEEALEILESNIGPETPERITQSQRSSDRMDIQFDEVDDAGQIPCWAQLSRTIRRPDSEGQEKNQSEWGSEIETESEGDVFVDAQNTIDSESDNDLDGQPKHKLDHYSKNVTGNSLEDECPSNDNNLGSVDTPHNHTVESPGHDHLSDESSAMSYISEKGKTTCVLADPVREEAASDDKTSQVPSPSLVEAVPYQEILPEVPVATSPSSGEAVPEEKFSPEEPVATYPTLGEAVLEEKFLPEEPVATYPLLARAFLGENGKASCVLPDPVRKEAVSDDKAFQEPGEPDSSCCPSIIEAVQPQEFLPEESVATSPSLEEVIPEEEISPEKPVSLEAFSDDKTSQEPRESSVGTSCPLLGEALPDTKILPEGLVAAYLLSGKAIPDEKISPPESLDTYPLLAEAVPDENREASRVLLDSVTEEALDKIILPEEPLTACTLLGEAVPDKNILPEDPIVAYLSLDEAVLDEMVSTEEPVAAYPSLADGVLDENREVSCVMPDPVSEEAVSDGKTFQEPVESVVACCQSLGKTLPDEKNLLEEPVAVYPSLGEAVPAEKDLQEEPFVAYPSLGAAVADEKVMPEESVVAYPMLGDAVLNENGKVSCVMPEPRLEEAVSDGKTFQEPVESVVACCQSLGEALSNEKILPEEHVAYSLLGEANLNKNGEISCVMPDSVPEAATSDGTFQEPGESVVMCCQSLGEALPDDKILPEEPVATYQPLKGVPDEKVSPEEPVVAHPLREAMLDGNGEVSYVLPDPVPEEAVYDSMTSQESRESVSTCCSLLQKTLPDEKILSEPVVAHSLSGEAVPDGKILPEPVVAYPSSEEAIPEEKISSVKHVVVVPRSAAVPYKKILSEEPVAVCFPDGDHAVDEPHRASDASENERTICVFPEPISTQTIPAEAESHIRGYDLAVSDPYAGTEVDKNLNRESLTTCSPTVSVHSMLDTRSPLNHAYVNRQSDPQESLANNPYVESIKIWSNGSLLGLEPSKPPVFAAPSSVRGDIESKNNGGTNVLATEKTELSEKSVEGTDSFRSVPCTNNEKASPPLAASEPDSQHSSQLAHHNGSHPQNTALSFGVFGLSHRLLMNGFRRNSSGSSIESLPVSKNTEAAVEGRLGLLHQQTHDSTFFIEPFGCQSLLRAPPSPPLEHMKISFNRIDGFAGSKLKLKIPHQPQYSLRNSDMFSSFQLVPEFASPRNHDSDSDDENDTFCGSSPCISDNHSASDSELWESDESPVGKDKDLVNTFRSVSSGDSTSSFFSQVVDRSAHDEISMDPFLDFPCFDAVDPSLVRDRKLKSPTEPLSPALRGSFEHKQALALKSPGETAESVPLSKKPDREKSPNLDNNRQDVNMEDFSLLI